MKAISTRIILAVILAAALITGGVFAVRAISGGGDRQMPPDTSGAVLAVTQNGDTIVFNPDGTYLIQGDVEIQGIVFDYETQGTYSVIDGHLVLNEPDPMISVSSKLGSFELPGAIATEVTDGTQIIHLEASNETDTFVLAHFELGAEQAERLGVTGITADSWQEEPAPSESPAPNASEEPAYVTPELDADGALLTVDSAGNTIAFFPDGTFRLLAHFTQSDGGLNITFDYTLEGKYSVENGVLSLPAETTGALNSDFIAEYGYTDVETPTKCTAEIVDGLLELRFVIQVDSGEREVAVFKLGQKDAEKLGVKGVEGETVSEEKSAEEEKPANANAAPAQPSISASATPLSFYSGGYTITFYSNGQYKQTGTVYANGTAVSVTVTDNYTVDSAGNLSMNTSNPVSCYTTFSGSTLSFGAGNNTSCTRAGGGYRVTFNAYANDQNYFVGSVTLSAADIKSIQQNYGLAGEEPEPTATPAPTTTPEPTAAPDPSVEEDSIKLSSEAGLDLVFYPDHGTFDLTGKTVLSGMELAAYSLTAPGTYSTNNNTLTLDPATLKITALHDMAKAMEGETEITFTVAKGENDSLIITLPIGDPPTSYTMSKEQAEKLGLNMSEYQVAPTEKPVPTTEPEPTVEPVPTEQPESPYTPDNSKTVITFMKDYGAFTISGAGKFVVSGMEADLSFNTADTYTVAADGSVSAANTADALTYTITMFGQAQDATATPETTIVKDGDNYKVTLKTTVNGQTITLCVGTVKADDVVKVEEPESPYTPDNSKTVITFMKDYGAFTISGAGKFVVSGMEADLSFNTADTYTVAADGSVSAANTADALTYTITMFGQVQDATATPETAIVKDGDSYKVTLKTTVNGQAITLCAGTVSADDVVKVEEPETPTIGYSSAADSITFDKENSTFSASGSGTLSAMGMDIPIIFTLDDGYTVSEDGAATAKNTSGKLNYTAMGAPGTTDPVVTITKNGASYRVSIQAVINSIPVTLLDKVVPATELLKDTAPLQTDGNAEESVSAPASAMVTDNTKAEDVEDEPTNEVISSEDTDNVAADAIEDSSGAVESSLQEPAAVPPNEVKTPEPAPDDEPDPPQDDENSQP